MQKFTSKHTVGRSTLALTVVTVVVASDEWFVHVHGVGDCFAEAVAGERHVDGQWSMVD